MKSYGFTIVWAATMMIFSHACVASEGCLEREWGQLEKAPTPSERSYDETNDLRSDGLRYSCDAYVTPTEVEVFMRKLAESADADDVEMLAELVRFPIVVYEKETFENPEGSVEHEGAIIEDKTQFLRAFPQGLPAGLRSVLQCLNLDNASIDKSHGITAGYGSIWVSRESGDRDLFIQTLGIYPAAQEKWIASNCE